MEEEKKEIPLVSRPIAVRWDASAVPQNPEELLAKLRLELDLERKKSLHLLQTLAQEKKKVFDLETRLIQASLTSKVQPLGSLSSLASTEDGLGMISLQRTSWAPRTFSTESLDSDIFERLEETERPRDGRSRSPNRTAKDH